MVETLFTQNIASIGFTLGNEGGVLLTSGYAKKDNKSPQELFALEVAKEKFNADAVYFRYFNDGRESVPQIYIYDNTQDNLTEKDKENIHKKVWSGCQVPIFIIVSKTAVKVFDAREKVKENIEQHAFETIKLTGEVIKQFSARSFDDGLFWEEKENENRFQFGTSAYRDLIDGLKNVFNDFQKESNLDAHVSLKLLVQCLLIKYLEERDENSAHGYFKKTYFKNSFQSDNFCEVIRKGKLLDLLDKLSVDFNGKIFEWDVQDEKEARLNIQKSEVKKLANYLDGNIQNEQFVLWRLYSFSNLPVELISSVYEELLTNNSKDIVYTPEMIVSTLIDECMPLKSPKHDFKLIDVSCGSGIFLVKAYKRIIQWWRYDKWKETEELIKPDLATLKELLINSIYGIDIQGDAIRLSVFSLALALLDEVALNPPEWQKLKFPDLGKKNILEKDFFKFITGNPSTDFDLVIGNPPFNPPLGSNGEKISNGDYFKKLNTEQGYKSEIKIPDDNPALHFLVQAMKLIKPEGLLCLIQPSGPLLYQKDEDFKKAIFSKYNLLQIIDFTKLADKLWGKKNIATAAVFLQNAKPDDNHVVHIVANRTSSNVNKLFLELDHYDFHIVGKDSVLSNPYVWKANIIGGGRIVQLVQRLSRLRTIEEFIEIKQKEDGWKKGEGFIEDKNGKPADFITGYDFLPTEAFNEDGVDWTKVFPCRIDKFHRKRSQYIYTAPHLLIRKVIGKTKLITEFVDKYLVFKSDILAIHAPEKQTQELKLLSKFIEQNGKLIVFYILATSSRVKINKATSLYDEDILNVPYPVAISDANLSGVEQILLDDVSENILPSNSEEKLNVYVKIPNLKAFSKAFCQTLNSVYEKDNAFKLFKIIDADKYYALHFEYTNEHYTEPLFEESKDLKQYIQECIPTEKNKRKSVHIQRVLRVYGKDTIIIAKPKSLRYWLQSVALRDADETFADYVKSGY